jgi:hypothetical protein
MSPLPRTLCLLLAAFAPASVSAGDLGDRSFEVRGPATEQIWVVEQPAPSGDQYAITGSVAYEDVEGEAFLEMWSEFPDGSRYFSRGLDERGPMARLAGSSPARPFVLPFFLTPDSPRPVRLELNVVLPAGGRVSVRDLRLGSGAEATAVPGAWWSEQTAGLLGGAAGSAVGLLGALIGTLCTLGRGRRFVMAGLLALGVSGLALLAAGLVALALGQPYAVWYPLVLMGVLDPVLAFSLLPTARRRFEAIELRRMRALDAR